MKQVVYVTGNSEKAANFSRHMGFDIPHHAAELDEIQTLDAAELVEHKARQAFEQLQEPVLVEDVSLTFEVLNGLPGPFIKYFISSGIDRGLHNMCRMLDGFESRKAQASCTFGYYNGTNFELFLGKIDGHIAQEPRGENGFGYDKIFIPNGFAGKTAAELSQADYDSYYAMTKPFALVREFLEQA